MISIISILLLRWCQGRHCWELNMFCPFALNTILTWDFQWGSSLAVHQIEGEKSSMAKMMLNYPLKWKNSFSTLIVRTQNNQLKRNRIKLSVYVWDRTMRTVQTIWSRFGASILGSETSPVWWWTLDMFDDDDKVSDVPDDKEHLKYDGMMSV